VEVVGRPGRGRPRGTGLVQRVNPEGLVTVALDPDFGGKTVVVPRAWVRALESVPQSEQEAAERFARAFSADEIERLEFARWLVETHRLRR
jgi:hypothetical protein